MAKAIEFGAWDVMPDGRLVPVPLSEMPDTSRPPEGLARPVRRRWQKVYDEMRRKGASADGAWYWTTQLVLGGQTVQ